jgi:hypothetical protein
MRSLARPVLFCLAALAGGVPVAMAEDTICTPEFYYNTTEPTPLVIPVDATRLAVARITSVDIETGTYHENMGAADGTLFEGGTFDIIKPGSLQERIDFVAFDAKRSLLIHIRLIDEGLPFTRIDAEGSISSGHCVYEYDQ